MVTIVRNHVMGVC